MPNHLPARYFEIGCRIPKEYFWVIGWGESDVGTEIGSYDAALHMAGIENYNVMLYTSCCRPKRSSSHTCLTSTMGPCSRESSRFSIPINLEHASQLVSFWPRSIAIQTAFTWAVLRASMPATDRSQKRKPIYGKRCGSFLRGVIKQGSTDSRLGNRWFGRTHRKQSSGPFLSASASPVTLYRY
jgi:Pyruvoyl-dependent arginine decarboxylase (PvlArgDC)